jgi:tetratricopeptide (TPR) repeat protein
MEVMEYRQTISTDDALFWAERYRTPIVVFVLVITIIGLLMAAQHLSKSWRENEATQKIVQATTLDSKLQAATQYLGTDQAALTLLMVASDQNQAKDSAAAVKTYQLFLANYPHHQLRNAAHLGLGYSEELLGETDKALQDYVTVGQYRPANCYNALALLDAARMYEKKSDLKSARQALTDCSTEYRETLYGRQALEKLKSLPGAK